MTDFKSRNRLKETARRLEGGSTESPRRLEGGAPAGRASAFRPLTRAHRPPADGIAPLAEVPEPGYAGVWTARAPWGGLAVELYTARQLAALAGIPADYAFYPYVPLNLPGEIKMQVAELVQKSKVPAAQAGLSTVNAFFQHNKSALAAVLPRHITAERMLKVGLGAVRGNPQLAECTIESLFGALIKCAEMGLEPNTALGHVYLIPFNVRRKDLWVKDVQVIIGYRGYIDLARRSGQIAKISAHEVRRGDVFEYEYGLEERLIHKPALQGRGEVIAYYAAARLVDGVAQFEVMDPDQIEAIRNASHGWQQALGKAKRDKDGGLLEVNSPWWTYPIEMGRKTVVRRLMKYLPLSVEMANAQRLDDAFESDEGQRLGEVLSGEWSVDPKPGAAPEAPEVTVGRTDAPGAKPAAAGATGELPAIPDELLDLWTLIRDEYESAGPEAAREALAKVKTGREALAPHLERLAQEAP